MLQDYTPPTDAMPEVLETPSTVIREPPGSTSVPGVGHKAADELMPVEGNRCVVPGCTIDLSTEKPYNRRLKVCASHLKAQSVQLEVGPSRFCQQCSRFHPVDAFDGTRRSCRDRLKTHNQRRKRRKETEYEATSSVPGQTGATDSSGSQHGPEFWGDAFYAPIHHQPQPLQLVSGGTTLYAAAPVAATPQMLYPVRTVLAKDGTPRMWMSGVAADPSSAFCYPGFRPVKIQALSSGSGRSAAGQGQQQAAGGQQSSSGSVRRSSSDAGGSVPPPMASNPSSYVQSQPCPVPYRINCRENTASPILAVESASRAHRQQVLQPYPDVGLFEQEHHQQSSEGSHHRGVLYPEGFQVPYSLAMSHQLSSCAPPSSRPSDPAASTLRIPVGSWPPLRLRPPVFSSPPQFSP